MPFCQWCLSRIQQLTIALSGGCSRLECGGSASAFETVASRPNDPMGGAAYSAKAAVGPACTRKERQCPTHSSVASLKISQIRPTHSRCSGFINTDRKQ